MPRAPEMEGSRHLPEAGAGHHTDTCLLQQPEAVLDVGRLAISLHICIKYSQIHEGHVEK